MSQFADLMQTVATPTLLRVFGDSATHTNADGDESAIVVIFDRNLEPVGEFGERMEYRTTAQVAKTANVQIGDTLSYPGAITSDDPYPDDVEYTVVQILADDGFMVTMALREGL